MKGPDGVAHQFCGMFKQKPVSSAAAEMMAAVNAIAKAASVYGDLNNYNVILQTDCHTVLHTFQMIVDGNKPRHKQMTMFAMAMRVYHYVENTNFDIRHVKAHQKNDLGPRHAVNNICDKLARRMMREQRILFQSVDS